MRMKVFALCVMVILLLSSIPVTKSAARKRVLYDRTHDEHFVWTEKSYLTDEQIKEILEANGFEVTIYKKGNFTYEVLQNYDALIICVPRISFTESEINDIVTFVKNGGGLYVLGTRSSRFYAIGGIETILNPLASPFNISYTTINTLTVSRPIKIESSHEITIGVKEVRFEDWTTLNAKSPAEVILRLDGFGVLAYNLAGFGKVVFSADDAILTLDVLDNEKLSVNILNWITTFGGPYKNYQKKLSSANSIFNVAMKLYNEGNMEKAKQSFSVAKGRYESLLTFYKTGEHVGKIGQCDSFIKRIDDELTKRKRISDAEDMLARGRALFDAGDYAQAQQILTSARDALQALNMTSQYAQASDMLSRIENEFRTQEEEEQKKEEERQSQEKEKAEQEAAKKRMYTFVGIGVAFLVILVVAVFIFTRGRKPKHKRIMEERESITRKYYK